MPGVLSLTPGAQPVNTGANEQAAAAAAATQRTPEESALLYELNRQKNEQLIQSGVRLPRMPPHIYLGGQQPAPQ